MQEGGGSLPHNDVCEENDEDHARYNELAIGPLKGQRERKGNRPTQPREPHHQHTLHADAGLFGGIRALGCVEQQGQGHDVSGPRDDSEEKGPEDEGPVDLVLCLLVARRGHCREDDETEVDEEHRLAEVGEDPGDVCGCFPPDLADVVFCIVRHHNPAEEYGHEAGEPPRVRHKERQVRYRDDYRHLGVGVCVANKLASEDRGKDSKAHPDDDGP
mmetsp:Transcript_21830/g.42382  ORF Transcript_21830/g.42382 Transcript_21830/m.42382 type:complete len:216 (-) Transcript_21830:869-1516(-)